MKEILQEKENSQLVDEVLPDSSPEGSHEKKLARYALAKARQELVSDYILQQIKETGTQRLHKELVALLECGSFLLFEHYFTLGKYKLVQGCTCKKHLLCALCAIRRAAKCIALYTERINQVKVGHDLEEVLITFTIRHNKEDGLQKSFDHILNSMKKLLHKRRNSLQDNAETYTEMKHIVGAAYSYEVTFSQKNGYHPHCHMIALLPKGVFQYSKEKLKGKDILVPHVLRNGIVKDWKKVTGGSYVVDVRKIEKSDMPLPGEDISGTRLEALVEVFKYALKMNAMDKDKDPSSTENIRLQVEAYEILKGRRLIGSFGSLWGIKIPENLNDEPLQDQEIPYITLVYQYSGIAGYQLTTHGEVDVKQVSPRKLNDDRYFSHILEQSSDFINQGEGKKRSSKKNTLYEKPDFATMIKNYTEKVMS